MTRRSVFGGLGLLPALGQATAIDAPLAGIVAKGIWDFDLRPDQPGIAVMVTRGGEILHQQYVGMANQEARLPIGPWTPFQLASVSKPFTALAVLQLVEQGRVHANAPVKSYIREFPFPQVRVHHLLSHTSGLPEYTSFQLLKSYPTNRDVVAALKGKRLRFAPGSSAEYNNTGYAVLAELIERVSGTTYNRYVHDWIFTPAGMRASSIPGEAWPSVPGRAVGYRKTFAGGYGLDDRDSLEGVVGDGGIHAPAADLDLWLNSVFSGRIVRPDTLDMATRTQAVRKGEFEYGYGWILTPMIGDTLIWHNGNWLGYNTFAGRLRRRGANIILLSNAGLDARKLDLTADLAFPIARHLVQMPAAAGAVPLPMARRFN